MAHPEVFSLRTFLLIFFHESSHLFTPFYGFYFASFPLLTAREISSVLESLCFWE